MPLQPNNAYCARILATITFHFRSERLPYLFQTVKSLINFDVELIDIVVVTNTNNLNEIETINGLLNPLIATKFSSSISAKAIDIKSYPHLQDPWHLPWCHKDIIDKCFIGHAEKYSHYINLEDDIEFSFQNFIYFLEYRDKLKIYGVIPSFLRVEYNYEHNSLYCTDQFHVTKTDNRKKISLDGLWFLNMENPHIAMFILDHELADEYVLSRSFDIERSKAVHTWHICERASMALCFENVPGGFYVRYVVPVDPAELTVPSSAYIYHIANNYTNNPRHPHGKMRIDQLFAYGL